MSSIVIKAYWKRPSGESAEGGEEIRRFSVDQDVSTSYSYLTEKIRLAFPSLRRREFTLFWKDSDSDLITLSNDDDLMDALSHNNDNGLLRIYIEDVKSDQCPSGSGTRCPPSSFAGPHLGVVCDGCDGPIFGTRFKCQVCPDYDLCAPCRSTGLHSEHQFVHIQNPPFPNMLTEAMKLFQQAATHGCTDGPCGGRGQPGWNGCWKMPAQQNPNPQEKDKPTTASAAEGAKESEWRSNDDSEQWKKQQEFLKNMGEFAAGLLNPFGCDFESDAKMNREEKAGSSSCSGKKEMGSDDSQARGCQGREASWCHSEHCTSANSSTSKETESSTSHTHSREKGHSPMSSPGGNSTTSTPMNTDDQEKTAKQTTSTSNEQAVRACLQTLKEMGFADEGGWLTSLVATYQGIIAHVLDAIQANQSQ